MANLKVNTDVVIRTSDKIDRINKEINDVFDNNIRDFRNMDKIWDGPASERARSKFDAINRLCCTDRYKITNDYVRFLASAVGVGYQETEKQNTSLADRFK